MSHHTPGGTCQVTQHAFVDESVRSAYLLAVAVLKPVELAAVRTLLRALRQGAQPRIHFQSEGDVRRRKIIAELEAAGLQTRIYVGRGRNEAVRQACLQRMVEDLLATGTQRLVLETRGRQEDAADRDTIRRALVARTSAAKLEYSHLRAHVEPLLWIPDAVAWCHGAGGDWRRRVSTLVDAVVDLGCLP